MNSGGINLIHYSEDAAVAERDEGFEAARAVAEKGVALGVQRPAEEMAVNAVGELEANAQELAVPLLGGKGGAAGAAEIVEQGPEREGDDARARDVGVSVAGQGAGGTRSSRE